MVSPPMTRSVIGALVVLLISASAVAGNVDVPVEGWIAKLVNSSTQFDALAKWVNEQCKPDSMNAIKVLMEQSVDLKKYQSNPASLDHDVPIRGGDYYVQLYCKMGKGQLGPVTAVTYTYPIGKFEDTDFIKAVLVGDDVLLTLSYAGYDNNAVYYLKRDRSKVHKK